jgi:response regulator RpfG family c-di-GMP phosphodiesterase/anti-sigma regulatory factor (Ser/Thr protein kinase)
LAHANEELTKIDILKSQFFANISHEIRTPLTSIMAPIQSLYSGDVGEMTPFQRDLVGQVYRNSIRLLDMVNQMLDFAKFDAKKMQLRLKRINLEAIVREHVTLFQEVAVRKNLTLGYQVTGAVPLVYLDVDKVERILSNLIRNAIKFTEKGSIVVELSRQENDIILKVRDTGIGIAKNQLPRIFERFQQVDGSSTRKYEGTGLGLTIVREAVELQHGKVRAESSEHVGTTITVSIPLDLEVREPEALSDRRQEDRRQADDDFTGPNRRSGARRKEDYSGLTVEDIVFLEAASLDQAAFDSNSDDDSEIESPRSGGLRVLYVEDSGDLRNYVRQMLRTFGHQVFTANDGLDGWEKALEVAPEVVVSDVMMPRLDGFELLKRIKTDEKTYHIPVVLITAKSETDSKIEGLEIGADDYLSKPIDIRELDARIRNLITTKQFQQALTRAKELETRVEELSMSFSRSLELRDSYTAGHSTDVLTYGVLISQMIGIETTRELKEALLLHDIGKIGIPDDILQKTESLTEEEWGVMRRHPELGEQLLSDFDSFRAVGRIIAAHHERYDGKGYPRGLAGDGIPLEARIVAVADAWHAMREDRAYRKALPPEVAVAELVSNRGKQFDPKVVDALLEGLAAAQPLAPDIDTF